MSESKLISPLLDNFIMGDVMSEHHGVRCYPAVIRNTDKRYIVKTISIPASQVQLDALLLAGAYRNQAAALAYFKELADGIADEVEILKKLAKFDAFVPYEDLQIVPMEGRVGYEVYLLSPYKRSLERYTRRHELTQLNAVNLGLDLCAAMVKCRRAGLLYVDLKPQNIFVSDKMEFKVGDLGFVQLDSLKYASLPDKYHSPYTPPEVTDALSSLNETIDTYAIGMILYQVYNDGKLPETGVPLVAPAYADLQMTYIILKAIAADPADRWEDPIAMGQALVDYMQSNSVNDIPIIPPAPEPGEEPIVLSTPEVQEEEALPAHIEAEIAEELAEAAVAEEIPVEETAPVEEEIPAEEAVTEEEALPQEAEAPAEDEIPVEPAEEAPAEEPVSAEDLLHEQVTGDITDMMAQVDDLISHEMPEPVVVPDPIEIPMPEAPVQAAEEAPAEEEPIPEEPQEEPAEAPAQEEEPLPEEAPKPKKKKGWIVALILAILLLAGAAAGWYYYNNIYIQHIDDIVVTGTENSISVVLNTDADESLLQVTCTDSYGNRSYAKVINGAALFDGLNPDTMYQITVTMDGFHELQGKISDSFTTPSQINIVRFEALPGNENGAVILNFTIDGKEPGNWTVTYSAEGENQKTVTFNDHLVNINGLSLNKEYTFTLSAGDNTVVGSTEVKFTPMALIVAENLTVTGFGKDGLSVVWTAPVDQQVESWTVHCYANTQVPGVETYDQQFTTSDTAIIIPGLDPAMDYTVEIFAEGMTIGSRVYVSANSATVTNYKTVGNGLKLELNWDFDGVAPEGGWNVLFSINGAEAKMITTDTNSVTIYPALPGATYSFTLESAAGTVVYHDTFVTEMLDAQIFSGYNVTANDMTVELVNPPEDPLWSHLDLQEEDYTTVFKPGERVGILLLLNKACRDSDTVVETYYVVRDEANQVVCTSVSQDTWNDMWYAYYCDQTVPEIPTEPGNYTLEVYFDGLAVATQEFTVQGE